MNYLYLIGTHVIAYLFNTLGSCVSFIKATTAVSQAPNTGNNWPSVGSYDTCSFQIDASSHGLQLRSSHWLILLSAWVFPLSTLLVLPVHLQPLLALQAAVNASLLSWNPLLFAVSQSAWSLLPGLSVRSGLAYAICDSSLSALSILALGSLSVYGILIAG
jgi:hypothetical protein